MKSKKHRNISDLISVAEYAKGITNRRGKPVSVQYIYKLIRQNKEEKKSIDFDFVEIGSNIFILKK